MLNLVSATNGQPWTTMTLDISTIYQSEDYSVYELRLGNMETVRGLE